MSDIRGLEGVLESFIDEAVSTHGGYVWRTLTLLSGDGVRTVNLIATEDVALARKLDALAIEHYDPDEIERIDE